MWALSRMVPNFVSASVGRAMPQIEGWAFFFPRRPVLYPAPIQFKDLAQDDATALIDFYDSLQGISELIEQWLRGEAVQDVNHWNVLMQTVEKSLGFGNAAVKRFCPDQPSSPIVPAAGSLKDALARESDHVRKALAGHLERAATAAATAQARSDQAAAVMLRRRLPPQTP